MSRLTIILAGLSTLAGAQGYPRGDGGRGVDTRDAVGAAILSDVSRDRQQERDARRMPYASPGYGPIRTAAQAADACGGEALAEAGGRVKLVRPPVARTMSTGWEVEGVIDQGDRGDVIGFVCSVRNGSVSGVVLR